MPCAACVHAWFTRGNAALVLDGPPSEGFRLPLRDGPRRPVPEPPATGDPRPAAFVADDTMSVSGEVARTPAASVLPELLQRAIRRDLVDLRDQPWATYESVGLVSAVVAAGFRVPPPLLDQVVEYTHGAVEALCRNGPDAEELAEVVAAAVRRLEDPLNAVQLADAAASDHLDGRPALGPGSYRRALTEVTVEDVAGGGGGVRERHCCSACRRRRPGGGRPAADRRRRRRTDPGQLAPLAERTGRPAPAGRG